MTAFPYIPVPSNDFLALLTRQAIQLKKLMPANLFSKCLVLGVGINFPLCYVI